MEKSLAKEMCIKFKREEISTTGEDCSKGNSKEKEVDGQRRVWTKRFGKRYIDCQQGKAKRGQDRVTVVNRHHYHCSPCRFVCKSRCFYTCFCIARYCFPCNNLCRDLVHELSSVWSGDCAFPASFVREFIDESYVAGEGVELTVHKESVVVEEIKEAELMRSRRAQFIYDRHYNRIGLQPQDHPPSRRPLKIAKLRRL